MMYHADTYGAPFGQPSRHRFNPHAPAFTAPGAYGGMPAYGTYAGDYHAAAPYQMNPHHLDQSGAMMINGGGSPSMGGGMPPSAFAQQYAAASATSSANNSFDASADRLPGSAPVSTKSRRNNPYASSNASTSEPTSPALAPMVPAVARVPADTLLYGSSMSSAGGSAVQSPVYAPDIAYGDASSHPIAFSINEQFAQARGNLAATACTPRGRHMLVGALRQQHTDKIQAIFEELAPNIPSLIVDPHGGHVVRTLIEFLSEEQLAAMMEFFTPEVVLTVATSSQNTRRVLQTMFERHCTPALQPIIETMATHAIALSTTQQGCIAVMRCIEHSTEPQKLRVLSALQPQLAALTMDPYGNYVVQSILQYFTRETACEVLEKAFHGHWISLSCNKFASNVMEKFIQAATPITRKTIVEELIFNQEALYALMQDGFGNFVLQQIIDTCTTGTEFRKLADKIRPQLTSSPFGHKIEAKLKSKRFGPSTDGVRSGSASNPAQGSNSRAEGAPRNKKPTTARQQQESGTSRSTSAQSGQSSS